VPYTVSDPFGTDKDFYPISWEKSGFAPSLGPNRFYPSFFRNLSKVQFLGPKLIRMISYGPGLTIPRVILFQNAHVQHPTFDHTDFREVIWNDYGSSYNDLLPWRSSPEDQGWSLLSQKAFEPYQYAKRLAYLQPYPIRIRITHASHPASKAAILTT
jgi:hypothetical protein